MLYMKKISTKLSYIESLIHIIGQCHVFVNVLLSLKLKSVTLTTVQSFFNQYLHSPFSEIKSNEMHLLVASKNELLDNYEHDQDLVVALKTFLLFMHKNYLEEERYLLKKNRDITLKDNHGVTIKEICDILFNVTIGNIVLCDACRKHTLEVKNNFVLTLRPQAHTKSISELLAHHFKRKVVLPTTNCTFCKQDSPKEFISFIQSTPKYMLLHIDNPDSLEFRMEDYVTISDKIYALKAYTTHTTTYTTYIKQSGDKLLRTTDMKTLKDDPLLKNRATLYLYEKMS